MALHNDWASMRPLMLPVTLYRGAKVRHPAASPFAIPGTTHAGPGPASQLRRPTKPKPRSPIPQGAHDSKTFELLVKATSSAEPLATFALDAATYASLLDGDAAETVVLSAATDAGRRSSKRQGDANADAGAALSLTVRISCTFLNDDDESSNASTDDSLSHGPPGQDLDGFDGLDEVVENPEEQGSSNSYVNGDLARSLRPPVSAPPRCLVALPPLYSMTNSLIITG